MKEGYVTITGGIPVSGKIQCLGAKNFVTKAMCAALLTDAPSTIKNVPDIGDVQIVLDMIHPLGVDYEWNKHKNELRIYPAEIASSDVAIPDSGTNRIPILLLSILLHRFEKVTVPRLGGCAIGHRKVNFHLDAIRAFGGSVEEDEKGFVATKSRHLTSAAFHLPYPSVGATETCLFLSVLAQGTTTIKNVAIEPEIMELITMLQLMGALIYMKSDREIVVEGVEKLRGVSYECPGDRIEAVSWACLACATDGSLEVNGIKPHMLGSFLSYFQKAGGGITLNSPTSLTFYRARELSPVAFETDVYPGFSTDWQQPFGVLLTQAEGASVIHETVYEKRFTHALTMKKMGASIELSPYCLGSTPCRFKNKDYGHSLVIFGKTPLFALGELVIPDLRAGLAYLIAACLAHGDTHIVNVDLLERGYGNIIERLSQTNIHIKKVESLE